VITPKQKTRTTAILVIVGCFLLGSVMLFRLCGGGLSHWPQVPPAELFVTGQPKFDDISGNYHLIQQNIDTNGLAMTNGRRCQIELRRDGSFVAADYPVWFQTNSVQSPVPEFISAQGNWHCEAIGVVRDKSYCGIVFSESANQIDSLALRNDGSPYNLMMTFGDYDEGRFMIFGKQ
jgi:hypothetical protein